MKADAERVALRTSRRYSITVDFSIHPRCRPSSWLQVLCDKMGTIVLCRRLPPTRCLIQCRAPVSMLRCLWPLDRNAGGVRLKC